MSSRDAILSTLRRNAPSLAPLPEPPAAITYPDLQRQFADAFTSVGGNFLPVASPEQASAELAKLDAYAQASRIASLVPGIGAANVDLDALENPHQLEGIQFAIIPAVFGVAENGAVWIPGSTLGPQRAIFVVAEHLALVLPAGEVVTTMHDAYERIKVERPGFGLFISGPSKTADIEQSLVIGAHGPRSCTLLLLG